MLMLVVVERRRNASGAANDALFSNPRNGTGAPGTVTVDGLNLSLAENHRTSLSAASILSQESGSSIFRNTRAGSRADGDGTTTIVDFLEFRS